LLEPFESPEFVGHCDFLSCNPPYISSAKVKEMHPEISRHEPQAAFNGGAYGVSILMKLVKNAPRFLRPGGWLGFEVGHGQGAGLARQLERNPAFAAVETYSDPGGEIRAILAKSRPVLPA
jgi:release factor glutamine methyltransferase